MKAKKRTSYKNLPFVSIIVLNYNGKLHLNECFNSLKGLEYPKNKYEIIMVDNASSDGSVGYAQKKFPFIKVIKFDKNYGFAGGNNKAVEHTDKKSEYIAFLNNDTKVDKRWLIELVSPINGDIVAGASKVLFYDERQRINFAGGRIAVWGFPYEEGYGEKDTKKFNEIKYIHHSTGCSMLVSKDAFLNIGKFDSDYQSYHEDVDLGWRLWLYGFKVIYVPRSVVYHKGSGTLGASPLKILLMGKNIYASIIKNFGVKNLLKSLIIYSMFHLFMFFMLLHHKNFDLALAQIKVYPVSIKELKINLKKRKLIQKNRKLSDKMLKKIGILTGFVESIKDILRIYESKNKLKIWGISKLKWDFY